MAMMDRRTNVELAFISWHDDDGQANMIGPFGPSAYVPSISRIGEEGWIIIVDGRDGEEFGC